MLKQQEIFHVMPKYKFRIPVKILGQKLKLKLK